MKKYVWVCMAMLTACRTLAPIPLPTAPVQQAGPVAHPAVMVRTELDSASWPLQINDLSLDIQVLGSLSTTTMTLTVFNPLDRDIEGQLYFPLGEGQTLRRFALDINGELREAVPVEKNRGRQVYEAVVNQKIDPGLLEWTQGNVFRARIFPIPARGYRTLVVAVDQELIADGNNLLYLLPMHFREPVKEFTVSVTAIGLKNSPQWSRHELAQLTFHPSGNTWTARQLYANFVPDRQIGFTIPGPVRNGQAYIQETGPDESWFYVHVRPEGPPRDKPVPARLTIVWDASASMASRDTARELALLQGYFQKSSTCTVELIAFSHEAVTVDTLVLQQGNSAPLLEAIRALAADGATCLGCVPFGRVMGDEILFIGDGLSNFGPDTLSIGSQPITAITSAARADFSTLQRLARSTGGQVVNLLPLTREQALRKLLTLPYRYIGCQADPVLIRDTWPRLPAEAGPVFGLAGKLLGDQATITLLFGYGQTVTHAETITLDKVRDLTDAPIHTIWAQKKLAELDLDYRHNRAEMLRTGQQVGLVTRFTSLLVLDRVEDYVRYRIEPPAELRKKYQSLIAEEGDQQRFELLSHLDKVAEAFELRRFWWETEFEWPATDTIYHEDRVRDEDRDGVLEAADIDSDFIPEESSLDALFTPQPSAPTPKPGAPVPTAGPTAEIRLQAWNPQTPYLETLRQAAPAAVYPTYLDLRRTWGHQPGFYLDVADFFIERGETRSGIRILSNLAEMELENHELLRTLARRLEQLGYPQAALPLYEAVRRLRPDEPQSYRDLALALAHNGQYQAAADTLYEVVRRPWPNAFPEIGVLAAHELNALMARSPVPISKIRYDSRLIADLPTDIRVVLDWDALAVDMDLWVIDPRGEKCYYANKQTELGGWISADFTGGYGPEEFLLRKAMPGTYTVKVNYYGTRQQHLAGPVHIQLHLISDYGTPRETSKAITLRLGTAQEVIEAGQLEVKPR
ncbi:MAG: VIT domain-containing protein [Bacteroidia bacterium]|nr:VIT domain-containing protein [Bacteroidia bacterium]